MLGGRPQARSVAAPLQDATIAAVVPVLDEAATIAGVLTELRQVASGA